eukprot:CAMPEP_0185449468 /NCGR_PEP_ID=MMETSP1365-20130426/60899_1 /TAXON_ID=38817 /ORGANISM="Gephyrocapsa oceanica, Strain RCC1303" /LENGTH=50 /DNA_ID=CAMNT_0028055501 /DNA_START=57 /DNA_END=205 /DNA_ORIENTATION=-
MTANQWRPGTRPSRMEDGTAILIPQSSMSEWTDEQAGGAGPWRGRRHARR